MSPAIEVVGASGARTLHPSHLDDALDTSLLCSRSAKKKVGARSLREDSCPWCTDVFATLECDTGGLCPRCSTHGTPYGFAGADRCQERVAQTEFRGRWVRCAVECGRQACQPKFRRSTVCVLDEAQRGASGGVPSVANLNKWSLLVAYVTTASSERASESDTNRRPTRSFDECGCA